eukprot:m.497441 g.497441  ORF g.497441 m.497441 type:complete len:233 (-) comp51129_c0_seq1:105-803(-)
MARAPLMGSFDCKYFGYATCPMPTREVPVSATADKVVTKIFNQPEKPRRVMRVIAVSRYCLTLTSPMAATPGANVVCLAMKDIAFVSMHEKQGKHKVAAVMCRQRSAKGAKPTSAAGSSSSKDSTDHMRCYVISFHSESRAHKFFNCVQKACQAAFDSKQRREVSSGSENTRPSTAPPPALHAKTAAVAALNKGTASMAQAPVRPNQMRKPLRNGWVMSNSRDNIFDDSVCV